MARLSKRPQIPWAGLRRLLMLAGLVLIGLAPALDASAARLKSVQVTETRTLPKVQPSWPVPNDPNQIFYLQRSTNSNTIVFAAIFDADGKLRASKPAHVYWRRYNTTGERKPLKTFEKLLAFGINFKPTTSGSFRVNLKPLPELPMTLHQTGVGRAELHAQIGGRNVRAVYAYVAVDEGGWIPKVTHLTLYGIDPVSGTAISETFRVKGGEVRY